ncbi:hypothetical protein B0H15DRAFT_948043 [Mycena belliarum]|uniref:Uncharacterized protein n=1 Tax=Mycena belliarum TaxID=1033014 RepID=A0AAD6UBF8_9AGAR|nr:hypothetical protein B0H15DRAFT_948043 [Mycena belliae]
MRRNARNGADLDITFEEEGTFAEAQLYSAEVWRPDLAAETRAAASTPAEEYKHWSPYETVAPLLGKRLETDHEVEDTAVRDEARLGRSHDRGQGRVKFRAEDSDQEATLGRVPVLDLGIEDSLRGRSTPLALLDVAIRGPARQHEGDIPHDDEGALPFHHDGSVLGPNDVPRVQASATGGEELRLLAELRPADKSAGTSPQCTTDVLHYPRALLPPQRMIPAP